MFLNLDQIKEITRGVVDVKETDGVFQLMRFTEAQSNVYRDTNKMNFYSKSFANAGVRLAFRTNSRKLDFDYKKFFGSSRTYSAVDVYENGSMISHFGFEGNEQTRGSVHITLSEGEKDVEVYFPWSARLDISNVELDDGAMLQGIYRSRKMISYGDSITHGVDAGYPSLSYASRLAKMLDADAVNKGIGGDFFFPEQLCEADPIKPDLITVAYGTNDWRHCTREVLEQNCRGFFVRLTKLYPDVPIYAVTPLWRSDGNATTPYGAPAWEVDDLIRKICRPYPKITVIRGWNLVPHVKEFYYDLRLHPNDLGFSVYAQSLYRAILAAENKKKAEG